MGLANNLWDCVKVRAQLDPRDAANFSDWKSYFSIVDSWWNISITGIGELFTDTNWYDERLDSKANWVLVPEKSTKECTYVAESEGTSPTVSCS